MEPWSRLPGELHLTIFEILLQDAIALKKYGPWNGSPWSPPHPLSRYSSVCKSWQEFFEPEIYRRITLDQASIPEFENLVRRRRKLVAHIWLKIRLHYSLDVHFSTQQAIRHLFRTLNTWDPSAITISDNLILEISIADPGELHSRGHPGRPWFSMHGLAHDLPSDDREDFWPLWRQEWLPQCNAIRSLVIRRPTRCNLPATSVENILRSLPNLTSVYHERCQTGWSQHRQMYEIDRAVFLHIFAASIPKSMKSLTLFDNISRNHNVHDPIARQGSARISETKALIQRSLNLEHFSVSYMVDAQDFFQANDRIWMWKKLQTLSLSCHALARATEPTKVNKLLRQAGMIALQMPMLKKMDLWEYDRSQGHAAAFQYETKELSTHIRWRGTWALRLDDQVVTAWRWVAQLHTWNELAVHEHEILNRARILSWEGTMAQLGLEHIINSVPLR